MKVKFLTTARQEVDEAYLWFENKTAGKGLEFLDELDRAVRLVTTYPHASLEIEPGVRRCIFAHFPYALRYGVEDDAPLGKVFRHKNRFAVFLF